MTGGKSIKLRVAGEDGGEMHFTVKKTTPLSKLMRRYRGDLLRSVLNIKNGVEIKSHCYIDSVG